MTSDALSLSHSRNCIYSVVAHDNGEFFTPPSIVQTIVNVIEPNHGIILDPACGSGGMFVQSSHFIEGAGQETMQRVGPGTRYSLRGFPRPYCSTRP